MENETSSGLKAGSRGKKKKMTNQEKALEKNCPHCWGSLDPVLESLVRCNACNLTFEVIPRDDGGVRLILHVKEKGDEIKEKI